MNAVCTPAPTASSLQPTDRGVISPLGPCYVRRQLTGTVTPEGSGRSKVKTWKGVALLVAITFIHDSWEEVRPSALTGGQKKVARASCLTCCKPGSAASWVRPPVVSRVGVSGAGAKTELACTHTC